MSNLTTEQTVTLDKLMARRHEASADGDQFLSEALSIAWCAVYERSFGYSLPEGESIPDRADWLVRGVEVRMHDTSVTLT